nr:hypothetical protein Iba_chr04bCG18860 [Ipomoea batatas]
MAKEQLTCLIEVVITDASLQMMFGDEWCIHVSGNILVPYTQRHSV